MKNHNAAVLAAIAGAAVLFVVFVSYRARTFHYCAGGVKGGNYSRLADSDGLCGPGEEAKEWRALWREGAAGPKLRLLGSTIVEAFGGK